MNDEDYMRRCLELAVCGAGHVSPNPMVGCVIVRDGEVLAEGYHHVYGDLHAERDALSHLDGGAKGATAYVSLEPCCHYGKQPPCVDALIEAGITRVVVGAGDPNPLVAGKGLKKLKAAGIEVTTGVLEDECRHVNRVFFHYIQTKRPYVVMKYAMTLDGKIACRTGEARWVTGPEARRRVHEQRNWLSSIMVGIGTVLADDPLLTCRVDGGVNPVRIICDTHLRIPLDSQIVATAGEVKTLVACCDTPTEKTEALEEAGVEILQLPSTDGHLDLDALMDEVGGRGIDGILLEGGAGLNAAALEAGIVQEADVYIAPKFFGGTEAPGPIAGLGCATPDEALQLSDVRVERLGEDLLVSGKVER
ncbi:MAG: bifunctional diaminohydroxyphosphoribosylaminopyrimidine deaminase/5-amino-6-(5-phosphoribosylamino)uracil reductase RibD [Coriobacteriales bacterium]